MSFYCPECRSLELIVGPVIELPPDARSDEISLQLVRCDHCQFLGAAVYEESRRGALDHDSYDHYGYEITPVDWNRIAELIAACPDPRNRRCDCESHQRLARQDSNGYWQGLEPFHPKNYFRMIYLALGESIFT